MSPFALFIKESKGRLLQMRISERGAALAQEYRNLDTKERQALIQRARRHALARRDIAPNHRPSPNRYCAFLKVYKPHWIRGSNKWDKFAWQASAASGAWKRYKSALRNRGQRASFTIDEKLVAEVSTFRKKD